MPKLLLAFWLCGVAAGQAVPDAAHPADAAPQAAGKADKARRAHRRPWRYIRRLGEMEVNLAIRLSSIGIHDPAPDDPRVPQFADAGKGVTAAPAKRSD